MVDTSIDTGAATAGGGGDEVSLSMPRKSAHDIYLIDATNTLSKFNQIVFSLTGVTDPRVVPYTRQCINIVLDDTIRNNLRVALKEALEYINDCNLDPAMKGDLQIEVCQMAIGEVRSYLDEFIGLAKTNAVVPVASDPTDAEVKATMDILQAGGDIDVSGEEVTDPDKVIEDNDTRAQPLQ
jgi:hypothetical protein